MSKKIILTVDDSPVVRAVVEAALTGADRRIVMAEDGERGLAAVARYHPDLLLLDCQMPVLGGLEMIRELRAQGHLTPVILLTGESTMAAVGPLFAFAVEDYIIKPCRPEELQSKVRRVLQQSDDGETRVSRWARRPAAGIPKPGRPASPKPGRPASPNPGRPASPVDPLEPAGASAEGAAGADTQDMSWVGVLVVDPDVEVHSTLRRGLPQEVSMRAAADRSSALALCRAHAFRCILVDAAFDDISRLLHELKDLQGDASFLALVVGSSQIDRTPLRWFDGMMIKPIRAFDMADFVGTYLRHRAEVEVELNVVRTARLWRELRRPGAGEGTLVVTRQFSRLTRRIEVAIDELARAGEATIVLEMAEAPIRDERTVKVLVAAAERAAERGVELKIVGGPAMRALLGLHDSTVALRFYATVDKALAASTPG